MYSDTPLLSVLVPAFNADKFIKACIKSLLLQSYMSLEILVCDDGSTDDTWTRLNEFSDRRLHLFRNELNRGKNQTALFLLEKSKGKFISVHDADDISSIERFEAQMAFLMSNPEYVMCGTNFISFSESGRIISKSSLATDDSTIRKLINRSSQFHGPTVVLRKDVIPAVGGFYRFFTRAEDIDLTMRVTEKFKVCNLDGHYYYYRHNRLSLTNHVRGYSLERLAHNKLLYYLAEERRLNNGIDTLMRGDIQKVNELVARFRMEFENDPEIAFRRGAFRLLEMQLYRNAISLSWLAVWRNPSALNVKCFVYSVIEWVKSGCRFFRNQEWVDFSFVR